MRGICQRVVESELEFFLNSVLIRFEMESAQPGISCYEASENENNLIMEFTGAAAVEALSTSIVESKFRRMNE